MLENPNAKVFEGKLIPSYEDGKMACICSVYSEPDSDNGMFVRVQSYDFKCEHMEITPFLNRKVRITVEVLD